RARELGFNTLLLSTFVEGEAREVGRVFAAVAKEIVHSGQPVPRPACVVAGGETTVTIRGQGKGGRNQELALAAALEIAGLEEAMVIGLATNGTDGPTDAAGALADGTTIQRAQARELDAARSLADNDSYHFFEVLGDLIITGPTNTNVNDLTFVLVF
ncbi:MAG TPA: glycerate kinase, partial [Anaerolineae bacterium]|nr:glycerate kinase [Anaerolineae bacterium]